LLNWKVVFCLLLHFLDKRKEDNRERREKKKETGEKVKVERKKERRNGKRVRGALSEVSLHLCCPRKWTRLESTREYEHEEGEEE
jgi:hypothetical protein